MIDRRDLVDYLASDEGHTVKEAADHFHASISTIQKKLAKVRNTNAPDYSPYLATKLKLAQDKVTIRGQCKGGKVGKRGRNLDEVSSRMYAEAYMSGLTIRNLSEMSGIARTTLWESIRSIDDTELQRRIDEYIQNHDDNIIDYDVFGDREWKR